MIQNDENVVKKTTPDTKQKEVDFMNAHPQRVYVRVLADYSPDGSMAPAAIKWEDGNTYEVDRVTDVRRAASAAGSMGIRYTVRILGQERRLFFEDTYSETGKPRWFVESTVNCS